MMNNKPHTLLALDYGIKKMGMALGNSLSQDAQPFDILAMSNGQPDWDNLLGIIDSWQVATVVVGLPLNMDGTDSMLTRRAAKFARRLAHRLNERHMSVSVCLIDERLSSQEARSNTHLPVHTRSHFDAIDDIAACLILNSYFNAPQTAITLDSQSHNH